MKRLLLVVTMFIFCFEALAFEKNNFFKSEKELENFFYENSEIQNRDPKALKVYISLRDSNHDDYWEFVFECLCETKQNVFFTYNWEKRKVTRVKGRIGSISHPDTSAQYNTYPKEISLSKEEGQRMAVIARYFIFKTVKQNFNRRYNEAMILFKEDNLKVATTYADVMLYQFYKKIPPGHYDLHNFLIKDYYLKYYPIQKENVAGYNDLGFFLEQGGENQKAIRILKKVIRAFPNRIVAYINLGDAYYNLDKKNEAKKAYLTYIKLMKQKGNSKRIPRRVFSRARDQN